MSSGTARRVWGLVYRHLALYRRSWPRVLELMYFPILQMVVWGFVTAHLAGFGPVEGGNIAAVAGGALIGGVLLWEVALRSQMGFSLAFMEEIWSRNLGHLLVAPLRPRELLAALMTVSILRTLVAVLPAIALAGVLYGFGLWALGPVVVAFFALLLVMGWAVGLGVVALILRYGAGAEALAWSVLFGIAPFACVFYPVAVLPGWLQPLARALPAAHVFEGLRAALLDGEVAWRQLVWASVLDVGWIVAMAAVFAGQLRRARQRGALLSIGE